MFLQKVEFRRGMFANATLLPLLTLFLLCAPRASVRFMRSIVLTFRICESADLQRVPPVLRPHYAKGGIYSALAKRRPFRSCSTRMMHRVRAQREGRRGMQIYQFSAPTHSSALHHCAVIAAEPAAIVMHNSSSCPRAQSVC